MRTVTRILFMGIIMVIAGCSKEIKTALQTGTATDSPFRYYRPRRIPLQDEPREILKGVPPLKGSHARYGTVVLGTGPDSLVTLMIDEAGKATRLIYIDANNNEDLTDDGSGSWDRETSSVVMVSRDIAVEYHGAKAPYQIDYPYSFYRFLNRENLEGFILGYRSGYRTGMLTLKGKSYRIAASDDDNDAVYDTENLALIIDRNQDGQLDGSTGSAERYEAGEPFNIEGLTYETVFISPDGSELRIAPSDTSVQEKAYLEPGYPAIPFSEKGLDGRTVRLEDFQGKVVLLDFWATWCGPCLAELPHVRKLYQQFREGFEIIGISLDGEDEAAFRQFLQGNGMTWPQIYDGKQWKARLAQLYRVRAIPATLLLDRRGVIRYRNIRGDALEDAIRTLLEE